MSEWNKSQKMVFKVLRYLWHRFQYQAWLLFRCVCWVHCNLVPTEMSYAMPQSGHLAKRHNSNISMSAIDSKRSRTFGNDYEVATKLILLPKFPWLMWLETWNEREKERKKSQLLSLCDIFCALRYLDESKTPQIRKPFDKFLEQSNKKMVHLCAKGKKVLHCRSNRVSLLKQRRIDKRHKKKEEKCCASNTEQHRMIIVQRQRTKCAFTFGSN